MAPPTTMATTTTTTVANILRRAVISLFLLVLSLPVLQCIVGALPLHWLGYEPLPHAGPNTVYVPGAGFSGFYYHLGFLHSLAERETSQKDTFYCYSSGCLGLVLAPYNLHDIWDAAVAAQQAWLAGTLSRYDIVRQFLNALDLQHVPDNVRILLTDQQHGVRVAARPATVAELVQRLVETTAIPLLTVPWPTTTGGLPQLDGGFSRWLHPACAETVHVPTTLATTVHTFNVALDKATAWSLYERGWRDAEAKHRTKTTTTTTTTTVSSSAVVVMAKEQSRESNSSSSTSSFSSKPASSFPCYTCKRLNATTWGAEERVHTAVLS